MKCVVHYSEIGIKGNNRYMFENQLIRNIKTAFEKNKLALSIFKDDSRIIVECKANEKTQTEILSKIFGIQNFSFIEECDLDEKAALAKSEKIMKSLQKKGAKSVALETNRSNKKFPLTSLELNKKIGEKAYAMKLKINFENPDKKIFIEITTKAIYFYTEKIKGLGGLPVGSSGRVLCLLSGGIDSPVAAWLLMKRGCNVDFIHFHTFRKNKEVLDTKISKLVKKLSDYQNESRLFLIPYFNYQISTQGMIQDNADLVIFKNYMFRLAQKVAYENNCKALVTGDSVGQVASQTLDNIAATDFEITIPVFRPVISMDKQEIIDIAKKIGTLQASQESYKDCCSIIASKPHTGLKIEKLMRNLENIDVKGIMDKDLKELEKFQS